MDSYQSAALASSPQPHQHGLSVLVVDDQPANIRILHALLGEEFDIRMATSGEDALRLIHHSPPDLILLDIEMPGMSGYDVCRQLKAAEDTLHIPVIFITAHDTPEDESLCFRVGAVDFIRKPINPEVAKARVRTHARLKRQSDLLRDLAFVDGLTGVANRRKFDAALDAEWRRCLRNGTPLSVVMIDVDHFKRYNDHYGHAAGDSCLQRVARQLAPRLQRSHDLVARYGGEEFVCLLPDCDLPGAMAKAEILRQAVEVQAIEHAGIAPPAVVTVSVGVGSVVPAEDASPSMLAQMADQHLYHAKSAGRNRVSG
ncbi:diguanylate cyclase [Paracidovorax avenae]|uniref:diguanylate cyclase n=1 Tax=Paracidovorax avenae TaxID=80867 RepID=UPI000D20144F|nr:diguanylate cyclase [Paracidovorax avenae]AVT12783.1 diguanylate cyclase response regulator [Paracidovorax avenae]